MREDGSELISAQAAGGEGKIVDTKQEAAAPPCPARDV